jgi:hypothetical protein
MTILQQASTNKAVHPWRPLFWEPVPGTGERLMAGVVFCYDGKWEAERIIRDDVLAALYGQDAASGAINLIEFGLRIFGEAAKAAASLESLGVSISGIYAGEKRSTEARSRAELLRTAALLYSSLANLDKFDSAQEQDLPLSEEVTKRFSTEIRDLVTQDRPDLEEYFGRHAVLFSGGDKVRFGFVSPLAALHFNVVTPIRPGPSLRDARARIFELQRCREVTGIDKAVLISAVPRSDDPTLGVRQRQNILHLNEEIEGEAHSVNVGYIPVTSASDAARQVILLGA